MPTLVSIDAIESSPTRRQPHTAVVHGTDDAGQPVCLYVGIVWEDMSPTTGVRFVPSLTSGIALSDAVTNELEEHLIRRSGQ